MAHAIWVHIYLSKLIDFWWKHFDLLFLIYGADAWKLGLKETDIKLSKMKRSGAKNYKTITKCQSIGLHSAEIWLA